MLPPSERAQLKNIGETIETLVLRRSQDGSFFRAGEELQRTTDPTIVRLYSFCACSGAVS